MFQMNLTMQSFIIVVGQEIISIENVYIRLDTLYSMPTVESIEYIIQDFCNI